MTLANIDIKKIFFLKETSISNTSLWLFAGFALSIIVSSLLAIATDELLLFGLPAGLLLVYQTIVDFKKIFYLLLFTIPLSIEFYLPGGLGTDLPTEPLVIGLMLSYGLYIMVNWKEMKKDFLMHPITLFLLLHLGWMILATVCSNLFIVSFKFLLAKIWYIVGYFFLAGSILKTDKEVKKFFWIIFIPFFSAVVLTVLRHAAIGFSFSDVHSVMKPFFRNHVLYASILAIFLPYIVLASSWYSSKSILKWGLIFASFFFLIAIYWSFTRTAYVSIIIAMGSYFVIRLKLIKIASLVSIIAIFAGSIYLVQHNNYMEFAPDFEKAVTHKSFDDLVSATSKGEDVSTMERVYRWVAGMQMSKKEILTGHGPGNFYTFYKQNAVTAFETYVSDNPDKSGIHCYYLMILTDQGLPGAFIFLFLTFFVLIKGENIYHQTKNPDRRRTIMAILLSIIIIDAFLLINDMVETDKVGSFFFINLALLINMDLLNQKEEKELNQ